MLYYKQAKGKGKGPDPEGSTEMVRHMFKAFENREKAKRFVRENGGKLLDPLHSRDDRIEYMCIKENNDVNTARYPCIVVWNEFD